MAEVVADVGAELTAIAIRVVEDAARPPVAAVEWPIVVVVIAIVIAIVIDAGLVTRWPVAIAGASGKGARRADGGDQGAGGVDGLGVGGGVYNLGSFTFDALTKIKKNDASTSNDDIFS